MEIVVTGIGLASALGSLEATWKNLLAGQSGIQLHQPFPKLPPKPLALIQSVPMQLETLVQRILKDALEDADLEPDLTDCGVVIGSSRGNQAQWEKLAAHVQATAAGIDSLETHGFETIPWLTTLPHAAAIAIARSIGTTAPVMAPMAACATGLWAIAQGFELIQSGRCQRVLVGAIEAPITPLTVTGFEQMGALAKTGAYPFDCDREGLVLGEGGAVLVLESAELATRRGAKIYGQVLGFGLTADGYHMSAPDPTGRSAIAAIQRCLKMSDLTSDAIGYIHTHGTATQLNDHHEARLIQVLFPQGVPISSTKGATGHTIGASGALGAAFCLLSLKHQLLPPCVGLRQPEFALNFVRSVYPEMIKSALCVSFGFGGQNAAIAFGKA